MFFLWIESNYRVFFPLNHLHVDSISCLHSRFQSFLHFKVCQCNTVKCVVLNSYSSKWVLSLKNREALKGNPHVIFSLDCCCGSTMTFNAPLASRVCVLKEQLSQKLKHDLLTCMLLRPRVIWLLLWNPPNFNESPSCSFLMNARGWRCEETKS